MKKQNAINRKSPTSRRRPSKTRGITHFAKNIPSYYAHFYANILSGV